MPSNSIETFRFQTLYHVDVCATVVHDKSSGSTIDLVCPQKNSTLDSNLGLFAPDIGWLLY